MPPIPASFPLCIDGRMLADGGTGVARYAASLAATLPLLGGRATILSDEPDTRMARWRTAAAPWGVSAALRPPTALGMIDVLHAPRLFRAAHVHFGLYRRLMRVRTAAGPGLMHWTYPVPMRMSGWINLYTVHDVIPLDRPDLSRVDPVRLRAVLDRIVRSGDTMVTVSDDARERIIACLGCPPEQVVNCYQAVDPVPPRAVLRLPAGLLPQHYLLYCGLDEPRKNLPRLIAAYRSSGVTLPLVLAGPVAAAGADPGGVIRLRYVPDTVLRDLQAGATALVFPSLAEGFGLPVVEAMAAGTPVLTSRTGALGEIAGDAALTVDPEDTSAIAAGLRLIAGDAALREQLARAGLHRAARFCRARFAARLRRVYANAIARHGAALPDGTGSACA